MRRNSGTIAIAGLVGFVIFLGLGIALQPDLRPAKTYLSEYAVGARGIPARIGFLSLAIASLAVAFGVGRAPTSARGRVGAALLWVWGLCALAAVAFPIDMQGAPPTTAGIIHVVVSFVGFVSLFVAMGLLSRFFRTSPERSRPELLARLLSIAAPIAFVAEATYFVPFGLPGVGQWPLFAAVIGWHWIAATWIRSQTQRLG